MQFAQLKRREFITLLGGAAVAWPISTRAQQPERMRRLGALIDYAESDPAAQSLIAAFRGELAKLGWAEGRNLRTELRWSAGNADRIRTLAKELVDLQPDAILARGTPETGALCRETQTIPIVFALVSDPIASGFTTSLAHPDRNATGFALYEHSMGGKWLAILKEIAPSTVRVALLFNPTTAPPLEFFLPSIQAAASSFDVQVSAARVYAKAEIEGVIAELARDPGGGLIVMPDSFNVTNRELIIALASRYRVPAISDTRFYTESGGLINYGSDFVTQFRKAAGYVDRVLKGAKPSDLPIQEPTKFDVVINLKAAKALGLTVPTSLIVAAEVIE
jgi:putative tryptophan/tyrosine transport system substrate-binding protein